MKCDAATPCDFTVACSDYQVYYGYVEKSHWSILRQVLTPSLLAYLCPRQSFGHVSNDYTLINFDTDIRFGLVDADQWSWGGGGGGKTTVIKRRRYLCGPCHPHHPWHVFLRPACNTVKRVILYIFCSYENSVKYVYSDRPTFG
jgi:hypothetical protein